MPHILCRQMPTRKHSICIGKIKTTFEQCFVALNDIEDYLDRIIVCTENNLTMAWTEVQKDPTTYAEKAWIEPCGFHSRTVHRTALKTQQI